MDDFKGQALLARQREARRQAKEARAVPPAAPPVIKGDTRPGSVARGAPLDSRVTRRGRSIRRAGLLTAMVSNLPAELVRSMRPKERAALAALVESDR